MKLYHSLFLAFVLFLLSGCGSYKVIYKMPSKQPASESRLSHAHGFGLFGGGGYFFAIHRMFPALVDWDGPIDLTKHAPNGFAEIQQYHTVGQHALAAFISWLIIVNPYHLSTIKITHAKDPSK